MNHRPRKRFGQNFLQDSAYQQRIANSIQLREGAKCIEIGPGKGAITAHLLKRFDSLDVIEMDRDLVTLLQNQFSAGKLTIHQGDVLNFNFGALAGGRRLSIIGNLPYNISSPLLFKLIEDLEIIDEMVFMLQREVVDRITAGPGSKTYGRLSVTAGLLLHAEKLFDVPPGAFFPPPKVMSSVVRLVPREGVDPSLDHGLFQRVVKAAFTQRRKTLRNALSGLITGEEIEALGVDPGQRAEQLDIDTYVCLTKGLPGAGSSRQEQET